MSPFLIPLILLGLPVLEALVLVLLARAIGWWLLLWLVAAAVAGLLLLRTERLAVTGRILSALGEGGNPLPALLFSARVVLAGLLLAFPGVISDLIAVLLLVWPRRPAAGRGPEPGVIEGRFRRED